MALGLPSLHPEPATVGERSARPHPVSCLCVSCERTGGGDFAVRAFVDGDRTAVLRLSASVVHALPSLLVTVADGEQHGH
jgi:hypothetical protein